MMHSSEPGRRERDRLSTIHADPSKPMLSPRQRFQSHGRTLSDDGLSSPVTSPNQANAGRRELQYTSSLRVHSNGLGSSTTTRLLPDYRHSDSLLQQLRSPSQEPDFIREEREAWNRRSPSHTFSRDQWPLRNSSLTATNPQYSDSTSPRPLRAFGPSASTVDVDNRPKTRHGNRQDLDQAEELENENETLTKAQSRFHEGSMNDRSQGVSSAWQGHGRDDGELAADSGRRSDSLDLADFQPQSPPPGMVKRTLHRLKSKVNIHADGDEHNANKPETKKGLRHSRSMWNMDKLGHTFKRSERHQTAGKTPRKSPTKVQKQKSEKEIMNERKRKAEVAYAEQFGPKRQKSQQLSSPTSIESTVEEAVVAKMLQLPHPPDLNHHTESNPKSGTPGHRRRPSRKELEQENDQLRALLRRNQSDPSLTSSIDSRIYMAVPGTKRDDPPPMPEIPPAAVLGVITNQQSRKGDSHQQSRRDSKQAHKPASRPVSTILEEDEDTVPAVVQSACVQGQKEDYEWPDDVF